MERTDRRAGRRGRTGWQLRVALLAVLVLAGGVAATALLFQHPRVLVYVVLAVIALLAYGAVYLIVSGLVRRREERPEVSAPHGTSTNEEKATRGGFAHRSRGAWAPPAAGL
jgi:membrane protein YdbS with pleckstrin-like domain